MANEMPPSSNFTGLSRKVVAYSEAFTHVIDQARAGTLDDRTWKPLESLIDTENFRREGVFLGPQAEVLDWPTYRGYLEKYAGHTDWEGTLRHITETKGPDGTGRVILELEERNSRDGVCDVSHTVTTYAFDAEGRVRLLEVYVMPWGPKAD